MEGNISKKNWWVVAAAAVVLAIVILLVGLFMLPIDLIWRVVLVVVEVALVGALIWRTNNKKT